MFSESLARAPAPAAAGPGRKPHGAPPARLRSAVEVGWIVVLFFLLGGGPAPAVNEPHYLSRAKHFWNADFCRGDFFLESADAHPLFFAVFGWITRWLSLPASAWVGRFVGWLLLAASWQRLSSAFVPRAGYSLLSSALWVTLIQHGHMSGEWIIGGIEAKVFAYACVLWGLGCWVRGQTNGAWILFGAATAFHVLVGGWTIAIVLVSSCLSGSRERRELARSLPGLFTAGVISLVGLLPAWQLNADLPETWVARAEEIYVFDRISHHLLIRDFNRTYIFRHVLLIGLLGAVSVALRDHQRYQRLARPVWGAVLLALAGALLDRVLGDSRWTAHILRYYWFRASDVFVPLGISLAAIALFARWSLTRPRWAAAGLAIALVFAGGQLVATVAQLQRQRLPAADLQGGIHSLRQWLAWRAACDWVDTNVPASACFLTPPDHQTFKWYAQRPEVVTWKDVPQDAESIIEWSRRLTRVRRWQQSTTLAESNARFAELRDDYEFEYALIRWPTPFPLPSWPIIYRNSDYVILYIGSSLAD